VMGWYWKYFLTIRMSTVKNKNTKPRSVFLQRKEV
jgi:hypothetical protein